MIDKKVSQTTLIQNDHRDDREPTLTAEEAARILTITPAMVCKMARQGVLTGTRANGHSWEFQAADVESVRAERAQAGLPRRVTALAPSPFHTALKRALKQSNITLSAAATESGLSESTIYGWCTEQRKPLHDRLTRLAEVLQAPELLTLIAVRYRTIKLRCRECGATRDEEPGLVRSFEKDRDPARISVAWDRGEAEHICNGCSASANVRTSIQRIIKRKGRAGLRDRAKYLLIWKETHPDERAEIARANAANRRTPHPDLPVSKARAKLGRLKLKLNGTLSLCAICHRLLFTKASDTQARYERGIQPTRSFHRVCLGEWRKSTAWHEWMSQTRMRDSDTPASPMPLPPPPTHRPVTEVSLAEAYETTLRYFWQREGSKRAERDRNGEVRSITWLANELGISRRTLHQRVERFLDLLPGDRTAAREVRTWREAFLTLKKQHRVGVDNR